MSRLLAGRELATVLAALRYWQRNSMDVTGGPEDEIASNLGSYEPLNVDEIDALCERINFGEGLATPEEVAAAREEYGDDGIQIDQTAEVSRTDDGAWIQAWVWLGSEFLAGRQS